jgi:HD-like signal output (HDOD) protein
VILELLNYLERPPGEIVLKDLCQAISIDPKASAVLLKAANASTNGLAREIISVPDAVRLLGVRPTIGRILNAAMTDGMNSLANGLPPDLQIWLTRRGMLIASAASAFAKDLEGAAEESAFLIGILQDVGIVCLLRKHTEQYRGVLSRWRSVGHLKLAAIEQSEFGTTHAEASAALMERWSMPRSLILPVLHHLDTASEAARHGIDASLYRVMTTAEAVADNTDAPHPKRRLTLTSFLAQYGIARKSNCLRSLASSTARAAEAFHMLEVPSPSAADLETMVRSAISDDLLPAEADSSPQPEPAAADLPPR